MHLQIKTSISTHPSEVMLQSMTLLTHLPFSLPPHSRIRSEAKTTGNCWPRLSCFMRGETRERGGETNPKPHGPALGLCLGSSICLFKAQEVNRAFISLSGLGQDTTTEKNSCLNPRLFDSQWLFHKNYSSRKGRCCDIRQPKCLPARPFALGEHAGSERTVSASTSAGTSERADQAWS